MMTKIVIAEPSVILRSGILAVLQSLNAFPMELVEVSELDQLKASLNWQQPDLVLLNPSALNLLTVPQLKKEANNPRLKAIALQTTLTDPLLLKPFDEVISLYDTSDQIREKLTHLLTSTEPQTEPEVLSAREKEIVVAVIQGLTNKQIADKLCLSSHTVISHRRNIAAKLQIHSTAGLTIYAIVNKLVEL
jgi:DNA-binding NarL/FixJ family response regulator